MYIFVFLHIRAPNFRNTVSAFDVTQNSSQEIGSLKMKNNTNNQKIVSNFIIVADDLNDMKKCH